MQEQQQQQQQMRSELSDFYAAILGGFLGSVVVEASVLAAKTLACSLFMVTSSACAVNVFAMEKEIFQMFPFDELHAVKKPGPENVDGSETEDDEDEDEAEDPDEDEDEEEEGGEANGDDEGDPEDEPEANDGANEDDDEEDDEGDDEDGEEDDDEEEDEEDEEEEEDEDELPQPPTKKRK